FLDSVMLPLPPLVMAIPMIYAHPRKTWLYIFIMLLGSFFGGLLGYALGFFVFKPLVEPVLTYFNWLDQYSKAVAWLQENPVWAPLLGGLSPIPFKFFTISAGVMQADLLYFGPAVLLGRSLRLVFVALITKRYGQKIETLFRKYSGPIILFLIIAGAIYLCLMLQLRN
ncbi:MAG: YqaA family protein, partial [Gammaproteobacteria bacterium]